MQTILLIEDSADNRENISEILEMAGYHVLPASNGKEGIELALKIKPDLIICDVMMPVLDGYGVLHLLHRHDNLSHTPFIFLSGKTERVDVRRGMEMGADDYITKPFQGAELLHAVQARLQKFAMLKKSFSANLSGLDGLIGAYAGLDALERVKDSRSISRFYRKQLIYSEGSNPSHLYYVVKGKIKQYKTNEQGKELVVGLSGEGDFMGYTAMFEGGVYKESAQVIEDAELVLISRMEFDSLIGSSPIVLRKFIEIIAREIEEKERHLLGAAYNSLRKKVADALVRLYDKYNSLNDNNFSVDLSRDNLAAIAGVARESTIRTLSDFRDEHMIGMDGCKITIYDYKGLVRLAN